MEEAAAFLHCYRRMLSEAEAVDSRTAVARSGEAATEAGRVIRYVPELNTMLEDAYQRVRRGEALGTHAEWEEEAGAVQAPGTAVPFEVRGKKYWVDLAAMAQHNVQTGYERVVRRLEGGQWVWVGDENPGVGLYVETKRPGYYRSQGWKVEEMLVRELERR